MITVWPATLDDAADLLAWRNDPGTRAMCLTDVLVGWGGRVAWLTRTLATTDRRLLILEAGGRSAATARFDYDDPTEFSFTIAPAFRCKSLSLQLMSAAIATEPAFIAHIRASNRPCQRLAEAAGLRLVRDGAIRLWSFGAVSAAPDCTRAVEDARVFA